MKNLVFSMLAMAAMVSCTSESNPIDEVDNGQPVEIKLNAGVIQAETKAAVIEGSLVDNVKILKTDKIGTTSDTDFEWENIANVEECNAQITASKSITLKESKIIYYPSKSTDKAFLVGYYPSDVSSYASGEVTFTEASMDGSQDIIYAATTSANKEQKNTPVKLSFVHKLSQLKFNFIKDPSFSSTATVAKITVKGTRTPASLTLKDGSIAYGAVKSFTAFSGKTYAIEASSTTADEVLMVEAGANSILLDVELSDGTTISDVNVTLTTVESQAHVIKLTFKQQTISAEATIGVWTSGTDGTGEVI